MLPSLPLQMWLLTSTKHLVWFRTFWCVSVVDGTCTMLLLCCLLLAALFAYRLRVSTAPPIKLLQVNQHLAPSPLCTHNTDAPWQRVSIRVGAAVERLHRPVDLKAPGVQAGAMGSAQGRGGRRRFGCDLERRARTEETQRLDATLKQLQACSARALNETHHHSPAHHQRCRRGGGAQRARQRMPLYPIQRAAADRSWSSHAPVPRQ